MGIVGFDAKDAKRIDEAVRFVEKLRKNRPIPDRSRYPVGGGTGTLVAKALTPAGGIPAVAVASGVYTPGNATCTIYTWNGTTASSSGTTAKVYNFMTSAVAAAKLISVVSINGGYEVMSEPC